ncbi:type I-C CRISPR-associated protein Cas5c [Pyramidobacter piscolens]|uniref:type I-C CRISPR-associated protein Cas5c n=1 Tax=Pyramidobacter piscolens TaxID=638849 RepID=UPI00258DA299|nr:type I-C CRISPR-associated protein Cas5c [Pyramidobacter piscolens]
MERFNKEFCLEVSGEWACFTRPELKVERVSYDVITPSAARGIFTAIFWKPAIRWRMKRIDVLNPIRWFSVRRNEVGATISPRGSGLFIEDCRQQKAGMILRDVAYRLYAELEFIPPRERPHVYEELPEAVREREEERLLRGDENPGKYYGIFARRAAKGQYFNRPYLGCREFSCALFRLVEGAEREAPRPIAESRDFGIMLYDMDFSDLKNPQPLFFRAKMENGTIMLPDAESEAILR